MTNRCDDEASRRFRRFTPFAHLRGTFAFSGEVLLKTAPLLDCCSKRAYCYCEWAIVPDDENPVKDGE